MILKWFWGVRSMPPMPSTCATLTSVVGWSVSPRPTNSLTLRGSDGYKLERRSSFGLSIDPPARTTLPASNVLASLVSVLRTMRSKWPLWLCTSSTK